jgi:hypothetical protein
MLCKFEHTYLRKGLDGDNAWVLVPVFNGSVDDEACAYESCKNYRHPEEFFEKP